jgi:hypothetical protein
VNIVLVYLLIPYFPRNDFCISTQNRRQIGDEGQDFKIKGRRREGENDEPHFM